RDQSPMKRLWDIPAAFVLLTRLPLPALPDHAFAHGARAVWAAMPAAADGTAAPATACPGKGDCTFAGGRPGTEFV
ncbi:MAG: hypothetical protein AAFP99_09790, partial [Pseudomonadota bacterium]